MDSTCMIPLFEETVHKTDAQPANPVSKKLHLDTDSQLCWAVNLFTLHAHSSPSLFNLISKSSFLFLTTSFHSSPTLLLFSLPIRL
ncbi:hypothetical protein VNO77_00958 [Canavalia gladiata]|uniref:Uncharacterized protein n=1 Tax=Canavalia gladiata TaxID=3824 RepID=A0AAN9R5U1_CANGL